LRLQSFTSSPTLFEFLDHTVGDLVNNGIRQADDPPVLIHLNSKRGIVNVGDYYLSWFHKM